MIICEYGFEKEDPYKKGYSLLEVDIYAWIPSKYQIEVANHRLSLRKNLKTGLFELYRYYYHNHSEEVIFQGSFEEALKRANEEWNKYHSEWAGKSREPDIPCKHEPPQIDLWHCPKAKEAKRSAK